MKEYDVLYIDLDDYDVATQLNNHAKLRWEILKVVSPLTPGGKAIFIMEREAWAGDSIWRDGNEPIPGEKLMGD